jgi:hypothetical protein
MPLQRRGRGRLAAAAAAAAALLLLASSTPTPVRADDDSIPDWCDRWYPKLVPVRKKPVALLLGDSITQMSSNSDGGWAAKLGEQGPRHFDLLTRGFSGWNTRWWRPVAKTITRDALGLPERGPPSGNAAAPRELAFATLWLGANDLVPPESDEGPKYVPIDQYEANLEAIARDVIETAAEAHRFAASMGGDGPGKSAGRPPAPVRLLVVAPGPIGEKARVEDQARRAKTCRDKRGEEYYAGPQGPPPDRTSAASWSYSRAALRVAGKLSAEYAGGAQTAGVPVFVSGLDLHPLLKGDIDADGGYGRSVLLDGVHLTPDGQRKVGEAMVKRVLQSSGEGGLGVGSFWDAFPVQMPAWEQLEKAGPNWKRFFSPWVVGGIDF